MFDAYTHTAVRFWQTTIQPFLFKPAALRPEIRAVRYGVLLIPVLVLAGVAYLPMFSWLGERFAEENSYYSHGYLIPLVTACLFWQRREAVFALPVESDRSGLVLIVAGLLAHAAGIAFSIGFVSGVSFIVILFGLSRYFLGRRITGVLALPLLFLSCMIPLPQVLLITAAFKMKMLAAAAASFLVAHLGVPLTHLGSRILLSNGTLTVGDQCSGMNSLISLLTLGCAFACAGNRHPVRRLALVAGAVPIALFANIARISFLILASAVYGPAAVVEGPLHYGAGIVLWLSAVALMGILARMLPWR